VIHNETERSPIKGLVPPKCSLRAIYRYHE
jgi:hypothetical protein